MAPEKAMIKDETKIVMSSHTFYIRPISKNIEGFEKSPHVQIFKGLILSTSVV